MSFKIGVDGGGTKTTCLLVDEGGAVLARHAGPGCNPSIKGPEEARRILHRALAELRRQPPEGRIAATLLCMAGAPEFWREEAAALPGFGRVAAAPDSLPVLEAGTGGRPGLVLHAGTGSFVAARTGEGDATDLLAGAHYAGGLGWRLGDPGSAHDIGRRAIARGLLEIQGWAEPTPLGAMVRAAAGGLAGAEAITRHFYRPEALATEFAGVAPAVLAAAGSDQHPVFREIVLASAGELLGLASAVASRLFPADRGVRAGLSGHILAHPFVAEALARRAPFPVFAVTDAPEEGLRRLVARWRP
ncbi:MAG TPA: BadF/BadG/BcrA/BcrD ATPase family protein [Opitutaceae bacterium]|nr:BadF/BadG/BcrA/BcrD ATPase family protein [Opitutaceae bacterium]